MKKLLLIAMLATSLSSFAQYSESYNNKSNNISKYTYKYSPPKGWLSAELLAPSLMLVATFGTNEYLGKSVTYGTRSKIAVGGYVASAATHIILRYIRENEIFKNKKLICKRKKHNANNRTTKQFLLTLK